jgi:hypothetical protein
MIPDPKGGVPDISTGTLDSFANPPVDVEKITVGRFEYEVPKLSTVETDNWNQLAMRDAEDLLNETGRVAVVYDRRTGRFGSGFSHDEAFGLMYDNGMDLDATIRAGGSLPPGGHPDLVEMVMAPGSNLTGMFARPGDIPNIRPSGKYFVIYSDTIDEILPEVIETLHRAGFGPDTGILGAGWAGAYADNLGSLGHLRKANVTNFFAPGEIVMKGKTYNMIPVYEQLLEERAFKFSYDSGSKYTLLGDWDAPHVSLQMDNVGMETSNTYLNWIDGEGGVHIGYTLAEGQKPDEVLQFLEEVGFHPDTKIFDETTGQRGTLGGMLEGVIDDPLATLREYLTKGKDFTFEETGMGVALVVDPVTGTVSSGAFHDEAARRIDKQLFDLVQVRAEGGDLIIYWSDQVNSGWGPRPTWKAYKSLLDAGVPGDLEVRYSGLVRGKQALGKLSDLAKPPARADRVIFRANPYIDDPHEELPIGELFRRYIRDENEELSIFADWMISKFENESHRYGWHRKFDSLADFEDWMIENIEDLYNEHSYSFEHDGRATLKGYYSEEFGWVASTDYHDASWQLALDTYGDDWAADLDQTLGFYITRREGESVIGIYTHQVPERIILEALESLHEHAGSILDNMQVYPYGRTLKEEIARLRKSVPAPTKVRPATTAGTIVEQWNIKDLNAGNVTNHDRKAFRRQFTNNTGSAFTGTYDMETKNLVWSLDLEFHGPYDIYQDKGIGDTGYVKWMLTNKQVLVAGGLDTVDEYFDWASQMLRMRVPEDFAIQISTKQEGIWKGTLGELAGRTVDSRSMYTDVMDDVVGSGSAAATINAELTRLGEVVNPIANGMADWQQRALDEIPNISHNYVSGAESQAARDGVEALRSTYIQGLEDATYHSVGEVQRILFDYTTKGNWEELLRNYAPFSTWQLRNPLFWAQAMSQHPSLLSMIVRYNHVSETERRRRNLTGRFKETVGTELPETPLTPEGYYAVKPTGLVSLFGQFNPPFEPPQDEGEEDWRQPGLLGMLQWLVQSGRTIGLNPWPWISLPMEKAGLVAPGTTNLSLGPMQRAIELGLHASGTLPPGVGIFGESAISKWLNDYYVNRRLTEMEAEGLIPHAVVLEAMNNPDHPTYQEAQEFVIWATSVMGTSSLVSPFQLKYASPGELQIREATAEKAQLSPETKRWYTEANPYLESYKLLFGSEVELEVARIYQKYEEQLERFNPWNGMYKDLMAQRQVELDALIGPPAPVDELMAQYLAEPIVIGETDEIGNPYTPVTAHESAMHRLRDVEPRVGDFMIGENIDWEAWNLAVDDFMNGVADLSEQFGYPITLQEYTRFRYRWATPQKVAYDVYKDWRDEAWDKYESIQQGGDQFLPTVLWAADQQYTKDLMAGFTPLEAGNIRAKNINNWTRDGLPYEYEQKSMDAYLGRVNLQQFSNQVAAKIGVDMFSEERIVLQQQLDFELPGMFGESDPIEMMTQSIYDYYYNLNPREKREVRDFLGLDQLSLRDASPAEVARIYNEVQTQTNRRALFEDGILIFGERNTMPYWPIWDELTPEEEAELEQARVDMYRYNKAKDAGVGGTWTDILTKYYSDENSAASRFWSALSGVSLDSVVFDDPVMGPVMSRATRSILGMDDEQYEKALQYFYDNYDHLVDEERTQIIRDHPDWYEKAQQERAQFDLHKVLDMEILKSQYYAIYWKERPQWEAENPEEWEKLRFYIDNENARAMAFPYYSYFFKDYRYRNYWGTRTPDEVNTEDAPRLSEEYIQAQAELDAYVQGKGEWTDLVAQFFGPPPPEDPEVHPLSLGDEIPEGEGTTTAIPYNYREDNFSDFALNIIDWSSEEYQPGQTQFYKPVSEYPNIGGFQFEVPESIARREEGGFARFGYTVTERGRGGGGYITYRHELAHVIDASAMSFGGPDQGRISMQTDFKEDLRSWAEDNNMAQTPQEFELIVGDSVEYYAHIFTQLLHDPQHPLYQHEGLLRWFAPFIEGVE